MFQISQKTKYRLWGISTRSIATKTVVCIYIQECAHNYSYKNYYTTATRPKTRKRSEGVTQNDTKIRRCDPKCPKGLKFDVRYWANCIPMHMSLLPNAETSKILHTASNGQKGTFVHFQYLTGYIHPYVLFDVVELNM